MVGDPNLMTFDKKAILASSVSDARERTSQRCAVSTAEPLSRSKPCPIHVDAYGGLRRLAGGAV